ncbi:Putative formate/nitrite transporter, aquaporin [Septoria linicola]|uniref:Formate/nitrite transporter, aquaporin n=1 Tax=Septoria linicola TaxID=215465 RepID=A0A9Q9AZS0_9PEZI|nr:putative formate/nitrite transporter, aquaporin [Septoria linicola]USW58369.1 Putative formate/nitrite transporter, aquaporin [Septoria linicola]
MPQHINAIVNAYTPKETVELCGRAGTAKANMRIDKTFMSSVMAGMLLSFACAALLSTNTTPWFQDNAPGLIRTIGALIFPFGLTMVIVTGTDLCTGSFLLTTVAVLQKRISVVKMLQHWFITFWGNLAGSLFVVALITGYGETFNLAVYEAEVFRFNASKVVVPTWHAIFLRGIGANWLVCMACFLSFMAREYFSKVMAIWWPTFAFVCLGFDHVVANMYFVPTAIFHGDPAISTSFYVWKSLIPSLLGNIVSGALLVGAFFWYLYLTGEGPVPIDGVYFPADAPLLGQGVDTPASERSREGKRSSESPEKMV